MTLAAASGGVVPSPSQIGLAGLLGFFAAGVSLVLFIGSLRHLGSARIGAQFSFAPFIAALPAVGLPARR